MTPELIWVSCQSSLTSFLYLEYLSLFCLHIVVIWGSFYMSKPMKFHGRILVFVFFFFSADPNTFVIPPSRPCTWDHFFPFGFKNTLSFLWCRSSLENCFCLKISLWHLHSWGIFLLQMEFYFGSDFLSAHCGSSVFWLSFLVRRSVYLENDSFEGHLYFFFLLTAWRFPLFWFLQFHCAVYRWKFLCICALWRLWVSLNIDLFLLLILNLLISDLLTWCFSLIFFICSFLNSSEIYINLSLLPIMILLPDIFSFFFLLKG